MISFLCEAEYIWADEEEMAVLFLYIWQFCFIELTSYIYCSNIEILWRKKEEKGDV